MDQPVPTETHIPVDQPTPAGIPVQVDLTPAQLAAVQALSSLHNIPVDQITVVSTEAVDWPDGCLGVVLPGVACTQAPVPARALTNGLGLAGLARAAPAPSPSAPFADGEGRGGVRSRPATPRPARASGESALHVGVRAMRS